MSPEPAQSPSYVWPFLPLCGASVIIHFTSLSSGRKTRKDIRHLASVSLPWFSLLKNGLSSLFLGCELTMETDVGGDFRTDWAFSS